MGYEFTIAKRYVRTKRHIRLINVIMVVSVVGITVGVAALVIVMSVFNGFNGVVTSVLVGFDPHLRIDPAMGREMVLTDSLRHFLDNEEGVVAWSPYIQSKAMLVTKRFNRVVFVKGVDESLVGSVSGVRDRIVLGDVVLQDSLGRPGIVLGMNLADRLGSRIGGEITVMSPVGADRAALQMGQPLMEQCRVTGIFDSNNKDYDAHYAYIALDVAKRLFDYRSGVSGIEVRVGDIDDAEGLKERLEKALGDAYVVSTWYDLHSDLYAVMKIERWSAYIILCLIIFVAMFNVLGSLTMGVITKRRDIGILRAMGATASDVSRVFLYEGLLVGALGTLLGTVTGLLFCYLQIEYNLFPLDPGVYIIPAIPVDIRWNDVVLISLTSILFNTFASAIPAKRAGRLAAVDAIRWE